MNKSGTHLNIIHADPQLIWCEKVIKNRQSQNVYLQSQLIILNQLVRFQLSIPLNGNSRDNQCQPK